MLGFLIRTAFKVRNLPFQEAVYIYIYIHDLSSTLSKFWIRRRVWTARYLSDIGKATLLEITSK